jgi:TatD DNase family protein
MLFDTHTHLDQEEFDESRDAVVERALAAGVEALIAVGTTAPASRKCVELARRYPAVHAAVGIQPNYVAQADPLDWEEIERLASAPGVVELARRRDLPFVVHMRDCDDDILEALRAAHQRGGALRGVMHSFTGDAAMAGECVALGMHISFAGMVTYKKSQPLRDCAATIPDDRLLIETDCPYLSPEPVRGQRPNEPALIRHTAERVAQVRGVTLEELAALTTANARALFRI